MGPAAKDDVEHTMVLEHVNPTTRLLEKRRLMRETEETLDARKAEYKLKEQGFKRREEALKRKDLELQESLVRFSKFLQENDAKRTAAERKAAEEIKLRLQKEMEIRELTRMQENLRNELDDAKDEVGRNLRYERYLDTVLEAPDSSYGEIQDLLNRHKTLRVTNEDLRARDARLNVDAEETRARLHAYEEDDGREAQPEQRRGQVEEEAGGGDAGGGARAEGERGGPAELAEPDPRARPSSRRGGESVPAVSAAEQRAVRADEGSDRAAARHRRLRG